MLKLPLILILSLIIIEQALVIAFTPFRVRYWVKIENALDENELSVLDVHCKGGAHSADLGLQHVPLNGNFNWSFKGTKVIYYCSVVRGNRDHIVFTAFDHDPTFLDKYCGGRHCFWKAANDGLYLFNIKKQEYVFLRTWDTIP